MDETKITELRTQYEHLLPQWREIQAMCLENPDDEEVVSLLQDTQSEMKLITDVLNKHDQSLGLDQFKTPIYQVEWEKEMWYTCEILDITHEEEKDPQNKNTPKGEDGKEATKKNLTPFFTRMQYRVLIIGYNIETTCYAENLRFWQPNREIPLTTGLVCHAVHSSGAFFEASVDKISPNNTVWVTFTSEQLPDRTVELPLTHLHLGKHYKELRKQVSLTEEELRHKEEEKKKKKRERQLEKKQLRKGLLDQNANDWQEFFQSELVDDRGGPKKRHEKKR